MRSSKEAAEKIEERCEKITDTGCWIWMLGTVNGYGKLKWGGTMVRVNRLSYKAFVGPIPDGLLVCHRCDIPECCNPHHLFLGTSLDNAQDKVKKGRLYTGEPQRGERHGNARWTDEQILAIRADTDPQTVIAKKYGTRQGTISQIKSRKIWSHI